MIGAPTLNLIATTIRDDSEDHCTGCAFRNASACDIVPCCPGQTLPDGTELTQNIIWAIPRELAN